MLAHVLQILWQAGQAGRDWRVYLGSAGPSRRFSQLGLSDTGPRASPGTQEDQSTKRAGAGGDGPGLTDLSIACECRDAVVVQPAGLRISVVKRMLPGEFTYLLEL